jgi:hypothetical protein
LSNPEPVGAFFRVELTGEELFEEEEPLFKETLRLISVFAADISDFFLAFSEAVR